MVSARGGAPKALKTMSSEDVSRDQIRPVHRDVTNRDELFQKFLTNDKQVIDDIFNILVADDLIEQYCRLIGSYDAVRTIKAATEQERTAKGSLLFLTLHRAAVLPANERNMAEINRIAADDDFLLVFRKFYEIPDDVGLRTLSFHASGTTSLIFRAATRASGLCALKVIQAPYVRLKEIREATENYDKVYATHVKYSPPIHRTAPLWILMGFIEGLNLHEFLNQLRKDPEFRLSDEYIDNVATIFHLLTQALAYYDQLEPPRVHGDLSPLNVIVGYEGNSPKSVTLIDFGVNYVLKHRLGSRRGFAEAYARAELFTAPEVLQGKLPASRGSDFYSLGMICLDFLGHTPLRSETVGVRLGEIWKDQASIGLAEIIEDLVDEQPDKRLLVLKRDPKSNIYETLDTAFQSHVKLYRTLVDSRREVGSFWGLLGILDITQVARNIAKAARNRDTSYNLVSGWQRYAAALNVASFAILVAGFTIYTAMDVQDFYKFKIPGLSDAIEFIQAITRHYPNKLAIGDLWGNLPGRMVAITFGMIAARYYANIFSYLEVSDFRSALQPITNFTLRVNSISYLPPIMYAIVIDPHQWPICAFIGTLFPALNNFFCRSVARRSYAESGHVFSIEAYHRNEAKGFLAEYQEWFLLMLAYSISLLVIHVVLGLDWAKDAWFYAVIVCFLNIFKIYRNNCGREAPKIAGNLARSFFDIRRVTAAKDKNPGGNTAQSPTVIAAKTA
jgi:serine/threonine protein kinase